MGAFHFLRHRFSDVVEQSGSSCKGTVNTQLIGNDSGNVRNLHRMIQNILAVTGTVHQASQNFDKFVVQPMNAGFKNGFLAGLFDAGFHFSLGFFHRFFNTGRMNSAVGNQLFKGQSGNLSPDRIEARNGDRLRGVVNNQIHARRRFHGTDISAFSADDPAFHVIVGKGHHRNGRFGDLIGSDSGNGKSDNVACLFFCVFLELRFDFNQLLCSFKACLLLDLSDQQLLGAFGSQSGEFLQFFGLLYFNLLNFSGLILVFLDFLV